MAPLILASASVRRKQLLSQIGVEPSKIVPADLDETPRIAERPRDYATRLAQEKTLAIAASYPDSFVLGADTVVAVGRRILPKAETAEQARLCLSLLSGRAHRVITGVALAVPGRQLITRRSVTRVKVQRLTEKQIAAYLSTDEWHGKAGGYGIQGVFSAHIIALQGSYTGVVGLPLYELSQMLEGAGFRDTGT